MNEEQEITLIFKVPETDFDAIALEAAMLWVEERVKACTNQHDEQVGIGAYNLLKIIHDRYMDALGKPEWKRLPVVRCL